MNGFYQQLITDKSFYILEELNKRYKFTLIGGWAVYFISRALKSKDIDIVIDYPELDRLKKDFPIAKNDRLKKYEIKLEEIDIDIYLPYYSNLGIDVRRLLTDTIIVNGYTLPIKEILLITKQKAYDQRKSSIKGQKDVVDILSLATLDDFNTILYKKILRQSNLSEYLGKLKQLIQETHEIPELNYNRHYFAKKKKLLMKKL